jgi:hypothetical protein
MRPMGHWLCNIVNLKENLFLFLDLLRVAAEVLTMCCCYESHFHRRGEAHHLMTC